MRVPIESIQYLLDVFIEGGYAEDEDLEYIDAIDAWLKDEQQQRLRAFRKRVQRDVNPDYNTALPVQEWEVESRPWAGDPRKEIKAFPNDDWPTYECGCPESCVVPSEDCVPPRR